MSTPRVADSRLQGWSRPPLEALDLGDDQRAGDDELPDAILAGDGVLGGSFPRPKGYGVIVIGDEIAPGRVAGRGVGELPLIVLIVVLLCVVLDVDLPLALGGDQLEHRHAAPPPTRRSRTSSSRTSRRG